MSGYEVIERYTFALGYEDRREFATLALANKYVAGRVRAHRMPTAIRHSIGAGYRETRRYWGDASRVMRNVHTLTVIAKR